MYKFIEVQMIFPTTKVERILFFSLSFNILVTADIRKTVKIEKYSFFFYAKSTCAFCNCKIYIYLYKILDFASISVSMSAWLTVIAISFCYSYKMDFWIFGELHCLGFCIKK